MVTKKHAILTHTTSQGFTLQYLMLSAKQKISIRKKVTPPINHAISLLIIILLLLIADFLISLIPDPHLPNILKKNPPLSTKQKNLVSSKFDIFVINLDRDHQRLHRFTQRMHKTNLPFQRFSAIDGKKLNPKQLIKDEKISPSFAKIATPGEIGCALSHITLWKKAQQSTKPYIVIFEDDLMLESKLSNQLLKLSLYIDHYDFDLLLLGRDLTTLQQCKSKQLPPHMCKYHTSNIHPQKEPHFLNWNKIITPPYSGSTFAYIIPKKKIPKLLAAHKLPIKSIADREYWNPKHQLKIRAVNPTWYQWKDHESAYGSSRTLYHDS